MARYFSFPVFALVLITHQYTCTAFFDGVSSIVGIAFFAFALLYPKERVESEYEKLEKRLDVDTKKLMNKIKYIISTDNKIYDLTRDIQEEVHRVPKLVLLETAMNDFSTAISIIDSHFNDFLLYRHYLSRKPVLTLETFANFSLNRLDDYLLDIHAKFVPNEYGTNTKSTIPHLLNNHMQHFRAICNKNKSMNLILYQLFVAVTMTEIKSYIMKQFAYEIRETYYGSNHYTDRNLLDRRLEDRHRDRRLAFIEAMKQSSRSVWTCEPDESSVFIFRDYRPVYVPNPQELEHFSVDCEYSNYRFIPSDLKRVRDEAARRRVPLGCKENFRGCRVVDTDVCLARRYSPKNNLLPYERLYLRPEQCEKKNPNYIDTSAHNYQTNYCLCTCQNNVLTFINTGTVYSDYQNNRVITGARFSKRELGPHKVELFLEILEGELLANGTINPKTLVWKRTKEDGRGLISWPSARVNLFAQDWTGIDDVFSFMRNDGKPVPTVLTGLELVISADRISNSITLVSHLSGAILNPPRVYEGFPKPASHFILPQDPHDIRNTSVYEFNPFKKVNRPGEFKTGANVNKLNMQNREAFKTSERSSAIDSYYNDYLTFEFTDIKKDLGQTIVPFIDMQSVITDPPVPLAGAALYHKGTEGHGGYVGLELRTFDFGRYLV